MSKPPAPRAAALPADYAEFLAEIKARISAARTRAALAVNSELISLYWEIGREILAREGRDGWGAKTIDNLAADLRRDFPQMRGLSRSNLHYMRRFAAAWPREGGEGIVQRPVEQLPWGQNIALLTKLEDREARLWYARKAVEHGWSRKVLEAQIATDLRGRNGGALSSFEHALPRPDSELVCDALKDPYNFEFLGLAETVRERELEDALLGDVQSFLAEMGRGFALVGRQFPLRVRDAESGMCQEFFLDLLFYNYVLRRFVVIDLKIEDFRPEFAGKMNFYLNAVDELERQPGDGSTIGLVLCPGRNRTVTEWALRGLHTPVAVARYATDGVTLTKTPPRELRGALPELPDLASKLSGLVEGRHGQ
ncbi:MAG TPA: PDDEXK nuclease domain-containing protein [Solirubrobacteraceae bacterium]|jgi:predicted nuclease of restriction endonuclease-like (RecB) superfamily